ncbi:hypothetical protein EYF80_038078 [Liparis tanakae]|uniref:Uncharacterized protein n=1 Tax=Liparis tanakae TaxID=230148 RepID=A0A4Z2GDW1_9TELE|nr:hypothetical protein EYF80_038078 [Liparis tanakae]
MVARRAFADASSAHGAQGWGPGAAAAASPPRGVLHAALVVTVHSDLREKGIRQIKLNSEAGRTCRDSSGALVLGSRTWRGRGSLHCMSSPNTRTEDT